MRQYLESGFVPRATRVPDAMYQVVLDNIVVCCVDCAVVCQGLLLLGRRTQYPYKGWWVMGGRMQPGERYEMTAQRVVEREVGLRINELGRFVYIDTAAYLWARREQNPQEYGCHMEGNTFFVEISKEERSMVRNDLGAFEALRWVTPEEVMKWDAMHHPSMQVVAAHVQEHCAY